MLRPKVRLARALKTQISDFSEPQRDCNITFWAENWEFIGRVWPKEDGLVWIELQEEQTIVFSNSQWTSLQLLENDFVILR